MSHVSITLDSLMKLINFNLFVQGVRSETVDLTDNSLVVDISDALSEKEKVKFTVHTKVSVAYFIH